MVDRLKLYNKKITMSEYIRNLIILDNRLNSINRDLEDIKKVKNIVGRNY